MNISFMLNYQVYISLAPYLLLISFKGFEKIQKWFVTRVLWSYIILEHLKEKLFPWFLTAEIFENFDSEASKIFNSLNFLIARKHFEMLDTNYVFSQCVRSIDLSNALTPMSMRHLEKKWALKNWYHPPLLIDWK